MSAAEVHPCKWADCSDTFTSELDMGLHVMNSHLTVLDFGHFILERRPNGSIQGEVVAPMDLDASRAPEAPESAPPRRGRPPKKIQTTLEAPEAPEAPETPGASSSSRPIRHRGRFAKHQTAEDRQFAQFAQIIPVTPMAPPVQPERSDDSRRASSVYNPNLSKSDAARSLLRRLRLPPTSNQRLFQSEHFCVPCQQNCASPCKRKHRPQDLEVIADWKRQYGHLKPTKKALLVQLREMVDNYKKTESGGAPGSSNSAAEVPEEDSEAVSEASEAPEAPEAPEVSGEALHQEIKMEAETEAESDEYSDEDQDQEPEDDDADADDDEAEEPESEAPRRHLRASSTTGATQKMSRICGSLIFRIRSRSSRFRASDRSHFCLNCLSFQQCVKEHTPSEKRLAKTWHKYYKDHKICPATLIEQLEHLQEKYVQMENDAE